MLLVLRQVALQVYVASLCTNERVWVRRSCAYSMCFAARSRSVLSDTVHTFSVTAMLLHHLNSMGSAPRMVPVVLKTQVNKEQSQIQLSVFPSLRPPPTGATFSVRISVTALPSIRRCGM